MNYSITYVLEKKNNRPGEMRLRVRVRWDGKLTQFYIPYSINPEKWSKDANRCTANSSHGRKRVPASEINREIQKYEDAIGKIFKRNEKLEESQLKDEFNSIIGKKELSKQTLLTDVIDSFMDTAGIENTWSDRTYKHFISLRNHLKEYNDKLTINLTEDDMIGFVIFLQQPKKNAENGLSNRTTHKYLSHFRWFLKWATAKGIYSGNLHNTFKPKLTGANDKKKVIFLTWNELIRLYNHDFKKKYLGDVRDVFCFCCFTSLRYSDVANLKRKYIHDDHIEIVTQKTHDLLTIELNDYSKAILNKHKNFEYQSDLALPVISNQKMNYYLKEIGEILEFNELITTVHFIGSKRYEVTKKKYELLTTHCARRTFIVNALNFGIPATVIMKWTGHADYESMKPYIEVVDDLKKSEMNRFNVRHQEKSD